MKSAMQELIEKLGYTKLNYCKHLHEIIFFDGILAIIEGGEFLKKEKQQIIESHNKGQQFYNPGYNPDTSEKYYNETFD